MDGNGKMIGAIIDGILLTIGPSVWTNMNVGDGKDVQRAQWRSKHIADSLNRIVDSTDRQLVKRKLDTVIHWQKRHG